MLVLYDKSIQMTVSYAKIFPSDGVPANITAVLLDNKDDGKIMNVFKFELPTVQINTETVLSLIINERTAQGNVSRGQLLLAMSDCKILLPASLSTKRHQSRSVNSFYAILDLTSASRNSLHEIDLVQLFCVYNAQNTAKNHAQR